MNVSVCVIAYNEEKTLPRLLKDIENQDYPKSKTEIVLVDGMSSDNTKNIMENFAQTRTEYLRVVVVDNPKKKQAPGWNVAIQTFSEEVIFRIDAHASIPTDFVSKNVECFKTGEYVVGGPCLNVAEKKTDWKDTLLLADSSMFGSSIATYRRDGQKQYVKSICHGAYRREVFEKAGLFNEHLGRTEDNEIHYRIREAGYKLCFDPQIYSYQFTRSTLKTMLKQKYGNGLWVSLTLKACPKCLSFYHFVPLAFIFGIILTTVLALCSYPLLAILMWSVYWLLAILMSIISVKGQKKCPQQFLLPILFFLLHVSYGVGSLIGMIKLPFWNYRKPRK